MKSILMILALGLFGQQAYAIDEQILQCEGNPQEHRGLILFTVEGWWETLGQASVGPYQSVNVICPNAKVSRQLGKDISCVGIDTMPIGPKSEVLLIRVRNINGAYEWNGLPCK